MFAKVKDRLDTAAKGPMRPAGGPDRAMPSIIGPDMVVNGNLETPGEIHVEGRIEGDVNCSKLNVGPTGKIHGKVKAGSVRVHGVVDGAIEADEVFLLSGSLVSGDIVQTSLEIAPGASFEGAVRRRTSAVPRLEGPAAETAATESAPVITPAEDVTAEVARRKPPARAAKPVAAESVVDVEVTETVAESAPEEPANDSGEPADTAKPAEPAREKVAAAAG